MVTQLNSYSTCSTDTNKPRCLALRKSADRLARLALPQGTKRKGLKKLGIPPAGGFINEVGMATDRPRFSLQPRESKDMRGGVCTHGLPKAQSRKGRLNHLAKFLLFFRLYGGAYSLSLAEVMPISSSAICLAYFLRNFQIF